MCILALAFQVFPECPVFLAANRDESLRRSSLLPTVNQEPGGCRWFGGRDALAGGTWLGVNGAGLLITITNRRDRPLPANPRSRGLLCRDILCCENVPDADSTLEAQLRAHNFAGFNLLVVSGERGFVYEHGSASRRQDVAAGLHVLGNAGWDDGGSARGVRMRREFETALEGAASPEEVVRRAERICGLGESREAPALCISGPDDGTVSSSIVAVRHPAVASEYHYADGPPASQPFADLSPQFRTLFANR